MKKISYLPFIFFVFFLFVILSLPHTLVQKMRNKAISSIMPVKWRETTFQNSQEQFRILELENTLLKNQIKGVYEWLTFDQRLDEQLERLKYLTNQKCDQLYWKDFFFRRSEELKHILEVELQSLPAKIIFREPSSWSSSVWVNIGQKENEALGKLVVGKNSPVVVGDSLIGIVEYVGKKRSRIRLITDSGLTPSVRSVRGNSQDDVMSKQILNFYELISSHDDLFENVEQKKHFLNTLKSLIKKNRSLDFYLAKGELRGSSAPFWRSLNETLSGIGFNYDYSDEEGPKRDLKNGIVLEKGYDFLSQSILQKNDLLVTTGLDGVFPAGLKVAIVKEIKDLEEGDYFYQIKAKPIIDLSNLNIVFIMPPQKMEENIF